eukprot:15477633-Alexandrium_andersonii.AAC.1
MVAAPGLGLRVSPEGGERVSHHIAKDGQRELLRAGRPHDMLQEPRRNDGDARREQAAGVA